MSKSGSKKANKAKNPRQDSRKKVKDSTNLNAKKRLWKHQGK